MRRRLALECLLLFGVLPVALWQWGGMRYVPLILWVATACAYVVLILSRNQHVDCITREPSPRKTNAFGIEFDAILSALRLQNGIKTRHAYSFRADWNWSAVTRSALTPLVLRCAVVGVALTAATLLFEPERLFSFVRERPLRWAMVMALYPILSVVPQELLYRTFFCSRYRPLFSSRTMPFVNGMAFGVAHTLLGNWLAFVACIIGGVMFTRTYQKHASLALVCIEHTLYGNMIFTIGLGYYFYHGRAS